MSRDEQAAASTELDQISEQLFTGGYDGTEGHEGSSDTTWTDFGIICGLAARYRDEIERLRDEIERRAAENARLQDGVSGLIRAIYGVYEQAQTAMRKPSP